jgi:hypothetical protein
MASEKPPTEPPHREGAPLQPSHFAAAATALGFTRQEQPYHPSSVLLPGAQVAQAVPWVPNSETWENRTNNFSWSGPWPTARRRLCRPRLHAARLPANGAGHQSAASNARDGTD